METFEVLEECKACKGTGLYVGLGERSGAAIVCGKCKGTGAFKFIYYYKKFQKKQNPPKDVKRVFQTNPGIVVGEGNGIKLSDFGGMPLSDWLKGKEFKQGMENRKYTCPAWWYQSADYKKKPDWDECLSSWGRSFCDCEYFNKKEKCWAKFDEENK